MNTIVSKYNDITELNLVDFKNREILFYCSHGSNLAVENTILTLENYQPYTIALKGFFNRLQGSKFQNYDLLKKYTLFYRWLQNWLIENKNKSKEVKYISDKVLLTDLVEVSILTVDAELKEIEIQK